MKIAVFDIEANGFLDVADRLWCLVVYHNKEYHRFDPSQIDEGVRFLLSLGKQGVVLCCHNMIEFDLPILHKLTQYRFDGCKILDTVVLARLLNPEREGGNALEAWGERFGVPKPKHEDWSKFTPEMMHRCHEDVRINVLTLHALMKEAGWNVDDVLQVARKYSYG